jgi:hypothetical protein
MRNALRKVPVSHVSLRSETCENFNFSFCLKRKRDTLLLNTKKTLKFFFWPSIILRTVSINCLTKKLRKNRSCCMEDVACTNCLIVLNIWREKKSCSRPKKVATPIMGYTSNTSPPGKSISHTEQKTYL